MTAHKKLYVLIIDDDLDMCEALDHMFRQFDKAWMTYKIYKDPYDALLEMANKEYDLLLVDINIPEISGPEILKTMDDFISMDETIKKSNLYQEKVPVVLMSSSPALLKIEILLNHFHIQQRVLKKDLKSFIHDRLAYSQGRLNENVTAQ